MEEVKAELIKCSKCKCQMMKSFFSAHARTGIQYKCCDGCRKKFKCPKENCEYASAKKEHLKRHIKMVHNKIKNFKCFKEDCSYTCSSKGNLKTHLKTHLKTCTGKRQGSAGECAIEDTLTKMNIYHQL